MVQIFCYVCKGVLTNSAKLLLVNKVNMSENFTLFATGKVVDNVEN